MKTVFPDYDGFISDPKVIADNIFACTLVCKASQTAVFYGRISSLDNLMMQHANNVSELRSAVSEMYKTLFEHYFDSADVSVSERQDVNYPGSTVLDISIQYTNEKVKYDFFDSVIYLNGKSKKLSEVING